MSRPKSKNPLIQGLRNAVHEPLAKYGGIEIWWEQLEDGSWRVYVGPSDSFRDFVRSALIWWRNGYHAGYLKAAPGVVRALPPELKRPETPVVVVGHSLGGAVALHVADRLDRVHQCEIVEVVTLGAPKIARPWVCQFGFPVRRYVCGSDWGSRWFPWWYAHQQPPLELKSPNLDKPRWKRGFFDHKLDSYEAAL